MRGEIKELPGRDRNASEGTVRDAVDYRILFENSRVPMLLLRGNRFIMCNEAALAMLRCPDRDRLLGSSHLQISPKHQPDGKKSADKEKEVLPREGRDQSQFEWTYRTFDGGYIRVDVSITLIPTKGKPLSQIVWHEGVRGKEDNEGHGPVGDGYRDTFENGVSGIFRTTPDGRFLTVNPALSSICGFPSPGAMLAALPRIENQYVNPEDRENLKKLLDNPGFVSRFETQLYRNDKSTIWVSLSARAVKDDKGATRYYEGFVEDITQRRKAEEALRREKATFFTILDNDPVGVVLSDRKGNYLYVNREFTNVTGYSHEDVPTGGDWLRKAFPEADYRKSVRNEWRKNGSSEGGEWMDVEFSIVCKDGMRKDIEFRSTFLKEYSITVLKDVTKRKEFEVALQESEEKYRNIFENATEGIFQTTIEGRVISANPAFARLFGFASPEEMVGSVRDLGREAYADPGRRMELKEALEREGFVRNFEVQCRRRDGRRLSISANVRVVRDDTGDILFYEGTMTDITERKVIQEDLEQKSRSLEEANAALRALLAHREQDSHELEEKVLSNVKELVIPYVERLKEGRFAGDRQIVDIIETN
ncbi:MAG TPA: PAS domain-containing protein, partial [Syntrophorhabdaceae bacterium]